MMFKRSHLGWIACDCKQCKFRRKNKAWRKLKRGSIRQYERNQWKRDAA